MKEKRNWGSSVEQRLLFWIQVELFLFSKSYLAVGWKNKLQEKRFIDFQRKKK
jgi:hypothetical protein